MKETHYNDLQIIPSTRHELSNLVLKMLKEFPPLIKKANEHMNFGHKIGNEKKSCAPAIT